MLLIQSSLVLNIHWVNSPDDESEATDGSEEVGDLAALGGSSATSVDEELPDDDQVGNASNGVPTPLLWSALRAVGSEQTGQDHDKISSDGDDNATTVHASQKSQIEEEKWGGDGPVNVTSPVDLAVEVVGGVWNVLVSLADLDVVVTDGVASSHGKVGDGSGSGDQTSDNVIETLGLSTCQLQLLQTRMGRSISPLGRSMPFRRRRWSR